MSNARRKQIQRKRHARIIRRRIGFCMFTCIFVLFLAFAGFHMNAQANEYPEENHIKYYKSIQITPGDSLWSIAETYMDEHYETVSDYVVDIAATNRISPRTILKSGEFLILPYYPQEVEEGNHAF